MIEKINGVAYLLNGAEGTAIVTKNDTPYAGEVVLPAVVSAAGGDYKVTEVLDEAFMGCDALLSVVLGDNIESIGISAFEGCEALAGVSFGSSMLQLLSTTTSLVFLFTRGA